MRARTCRRRSTRAPRYSRQASRTTSGTGSTCRSRAAPSALARIVGLLQQGRISVYLTYSFFTLLALLFFVQMNVDRHSSPSSLQLALALLLAPLLRRLGQPVPRVAAEPERAVAAAALPDAPQAVPQGRGRRATTRRRSSASTPYIVFGAMCCAAAIVPSLATDLPFARAADAIALVGLFALARVFIALAAMDIGTAFGSLGARREMFVGFLAEPALLMVLFTASLISGSTSLPTIVDTLAHRELAIYPEPRLRRRRVHDGVARRERAHPGRQPGHAPRAHDDPRGDDPRVLGAPPRADRVGGGAQALHLLVHRPRALLPVRHRRGAATGAAMLLARRRC